jgi:hypothetical protein
MLEFIRRHDNTGFAKWSSVVSAVSAYLKENKISVPDKFGEEPFNRYGSRRKFLNLVYFVYNDLKKYPIEVFNNKIEDSINKLVKRGTVTFWFLLEENILSNLNGNDKIVIDNRIFSDEKNFQFNRKVIDFYENPNKNDWWVAINNYLQRKEKNYFWYLEEKIIDTKTGEIYYYILLITQAEADSDESIGVILEQRGQTYLLPDSFKEHGITVAPPVGKPTVPAEPESILPDTVASVLKTPEQVLEYQKSKEAEAVAKAKSAEEFRKTVELYYKMYKEGTIDKDTLNEYIKDAQQKR